MSILRAYKHCIFEFHTVDTRRFYLIKKNMCKNILLLIVIVYTDGYERFEYQSLIAAQNTRVVRPLACERV